MRKFINWHKLQIGKIQNLLRVDNYEILWLSWLKGIIMGIIIMSLLSGCYIYETSSTYPNDSVYYQDYDLPYYQTHYVPTLDLYYWNNLPYWGYWDGWYYYYGYQHMYPWWYYYQYRPAYNYHINTHVYCYVGPRKYVVKPKNNKRLDNVKNRTYNVTSVNQSGVNVKNNSNAPTNFRPNVVNTRPNINNNITKPNRNNNTIINNNKPIRNNNININRNNKSSNKTNINRSKKTNNKVNINRTNTNRNNSNRSNKTNTRRPR